MGSGSETPEVPSSLNDPMTVGVFLPRSLAVEDARMSGQGDDYRHCSPQAECLLPAVTTHHSGAATILTLSLGVQTLEELEESLFGMRRKFITSEVLHTSLKRLMPEFSGLEGPLS